MTPLRQEERRQEHCSCATQHDERRMVGACISSPDHGRPSAFFEKNGTPIYRCASCGSFMADIEFSHEQYESREYYTVSLDSRDAVEQEWAFRWRYLLGKAVALLGRPRVLDLGAGNGYFVYLARKEFGLCAHGVEISANEIRYAKAMFGVELCNIPLERFQSRFDLVTCFNVLEHVRDPLSLLGKMRERVCAGGLLFLTTPSPACIHRRVLGARRWNMIDPPHHINIFSREACARLLERAGFRPLGYETLSTYVRAVRRFDGEGEPLRRALFHALRATGLGADHFVWAEAQL
jgi:SAM-dependent methyltransferase